MNEREQLLRLCIKGLETKQLLSGTYKDRLKLELKEIDQQGDHEYFLKLVEKKSKFAQNENNLLIPFLLDLVDNVDLDTPPAYAQGEYPDIDTDYLPEIRDYLKNDWAPKKFGREFVCSISTYGTLGIKSVMLDVAKVHDLPRDEVLIITKQIQDKDDDGNLIEWDKAQQMYPAFKEYCTNHPEVAEAAQVLIDRRKSAGVHAGGLIISSKPLSDFVPLEVRSVNKDNKYGVIVAAWTEGQATQDLQPVGLVKFDLLVVDGLKQIALSTQLIKDRHNLQNLYALPGKRNWSDTSYLRDTDALNMASKGDLVCIFQFGSEGIRKLAKQGGIDSFQDLVALNALYRPGPMGAGMHETFVKRKTGKERYTLHPLLEPILSKTYGVMCFQEDVMKILNVVGNIPLIHCEKVRKAISKKKIEQFAKYKDMFVINGQKNLNYSQDQVESLWSQIESFADYGFNLSVTENTLIPTPTGLKQIQDFVRGDKVFSINELGQKEVTEVLACHNHGMLDGFEVFFDDGYSIICTLNHKFLTPTGQVSVKNIIKQNLTVLSEPEWTYATEKAGWLDSSMRQMPIKSKIVLPSPKTMQKMHEDFESIEIRKIKTPISMRGTLFDKNSLSNSSENVREMPESWLEKICTKLRISLWRDVLSSKFIDKTSKRLLNLFRKKEGKYQRENENIKRRKSQTRSQSYIFENCQDNVYQTGYNSCKSRKFTKMEISESGKICEQYCSCSSKPQSKKIQDGRLVEKSTTLGRLLYSLWRESKTSRFSLWPHMVRSGWFLPFFSTEGQSKLQTKKPFKCTRKGSNVTTRSYSSKKYNANSSVYGMFCKFNGCNENRMVANLSNHAPITDTRRLVSRKIVRIMSVGKRQMYDLEVAGATHNFLLPTGIVTSNSHAASYTMLSFRQLCLKTHYPIEFYTAVLMCESDSTKIKDTKRDALKHNIEVVPVNINKSKTNFSITDNKIYFGFSNLKKIGEGIAARVVAGQPYKSLTDFLDRFGFEANVVKGLIALGVFDEPYDRVTLYKFYEYYKEYVKRKEARNKRYHGAIAEFEVDLRETLEKYLNEKELIDRCCHFNEETYDLWENQFSSIIMEEPYKNRGVIKSRQVTLAKILDRIRNRREVCIKNFNLKEKADEEIPKLETFKAFRYPIDPVIEELLKDNKRAEKEYYGFQWIHELEESPDYDGHTIDKFDEMVNQDGLLSCIEVKLLDVQRKDFKSGNGFAWRLKVEDANGKEIQIQMWNDDYIRFKEDLQIDTLLKMRVKPPFGNFSTYSFESVPKQERWKLPKNKEDDCRLVIMRKNNQKPKENDNDMIVEM